MSGGVPYVGSRISLISKAQIRYEGMLYSVNRDDSTIALSKVQSFGTENRQAEHHVPQRSEIYEFIIFKADDIAELTVCEPPATFQDPAIVSMGRESKPQPPAPIGSKPAGGPAAPAAQQQPQLIKPLMSAPPPPVQQYQPPSSYRNAAATGLSHQQPAPQQRQAPLATSQQQTYPRQEYYNQNRQHNTQGYQNGYNRGGYRQNQPPQQQNWHDNQQQNQRGGNRGGYAARGVAQQQRGGTRSGSSQGAQAHSTVGAQRVPAEKLKFDSDFDWTETNAKFEEELKSLTDMLDKKVKVAKPASTTADNDDDVVELGHNGDLSAVATTDNGENPGGYDKKKSFFDNISCEALERLEGSNTRPDWQKEREVNTQTFGQAGVRHNHYFRGGNRGGRGGNRGGTGGYGRRY